MRGSNHPVTGIPTYVRLGSIGSDGPAFLGPAYAAFDQGGKGRENMTLRLPEDRMTDRRQLLDGLDRLNRQCDSSGFVAGMDKFKQQAYDLVLGSASAAFDIKKEKPETVARYGNGLGTQLLTARRLCEAGCGFVTLSYGGWDMHGQIENAMKQRSPSLDQAVSAFVEDVSTRGLQDNILLVISGEFGRTPRVNKNAGRDHWAPLSTLALSGGGLKMGQVVGESAAKVDVPKSPAINPQDLMATVFHVLGIDPKVQFLSTGGRPTYMLDKGKVISELV